MGSTIVSTSRRIPRCSNCWMPCRVSPIVLRQLCVEKAEGKGWVLQEPRTSSRNTHLHLAEVAGRQVLGYRLQFGLELCQEPIKKLFRFAKIVEDHLREKETGGSGVKKKTDIDGME